MLSYKQAGIIFLNGLVFCTDISCSQHRGAVCSHKAGKESRLTSECQLTGRTREYGSHSLNVNSTEGWRFPLAACRRERSRDVANYKARAHVIEGTRREERAERDHRQNNIGDDARSRVGSMPSLAG
jgi:hypothetical protein